MSIFDKYQQRYEDHQQEEFSLQEYLDLCKQDPMVYASSAERMLKAIGEPELVDTAQDPRLSRIFSNKVIARYPAFKEFYGMEDAIEQIVSYFKHAAQGLEEQKQILYLLGPVGGGKSSLAEKLKKLMETFPIYAIKDSPVFESPLGLFDPFEDAEILQQEYGINKRYLSKIMSPWAVKRLNEFGGDISKFRVVKLTPSILNQVAIAKTEPGDENNQDISALVGKVDIRKLEGFAQNDPDAYSYSGSLCRANQGIMEFVEMFKAPIKVLHPLLTATQEGNYNSTEGLSALPFEGTILAHSNESEWQSFKNNKNNEAFLDRVYIVKVPYCLRVSEEIKIYDKLLLNSSLSEAPCAPNTLKMLAQFSVLSRLKEPENSSIYSKMRVYDGESLKDTDPKAKSYQEYQDYAGVDEGMNGLSTRFAFKILSRVFNFDQTEVAANPVHLLYVIEQQIAREQYQQETHDRYLEHIKGFLVPNYIEFIGKEIQTAYLESYS
ncbi:MAG: PrkA family serine protein kinase, partial [Gammaproteobacteria bacterium]|nr:PrkA family serine protein kinase [Gammaproteobacteria bacterium]